MPIDMRMGPILKRNAEYWAKRFIELEKLTAHQSERYIKNLEEVFKESSENIENQIMKFYARFADIENISFSEARKLLNSEDLEAFRMSLEEYIKFARKNSENFDPELAKALEEASLKYRVTRLEALEYGLSGEVGKLMSHEHSILYEACAHAYVDRYYHTAFELFKGYGVGTTFSLIDNKRLEMILDQPWAADGSNFSQRIWVDRKKVTQTLSTRLAQACITGESYTKTLKKVGKELNTSLSNAARLVVTESSYFASRSQKECFDALGCDKYRIIATLDNRTSIICQSLDGEVFKTKEFIAGVSAPPFHPNCVAGDTKIAAPDGTALMKSEYSGPVIELATANGGRLTVTPNHILLTARGWVRAKNLIKGDQVIRYSGWDEFILGTNPAMNNSVTTIEDLFSAVGEFPGVFSMSVPMSAVDFKGDGTENGKVDIVFIDSLLRDKIDTSLGKFLRDFPLVGTEKLNEVVLTGNCSLAQLLAGIGLAADGVVSGHGIAGILLGGSLTHHDLIRFCGGTQYDARIKQTAFNSGVFNGKSPCKAVKAFTGLVEGNNFLNREFFSAVGVSDCNSIFLKNSDDGLSSVPKNLCDFRDRFAGIIEFDDIIGVNVSNFSGHVYDISSLSTLYLANGIISSNCRTTTCPYFDDSDVPGWVQGTRTARNPGEKTYRIPADMNYEQWRKKYKIEPIYGAYERPGGLVKKK